MNKGHLFIAIKDNRVTFSFVDGLRNASGSNPHDGSVVDAERQADYFTKLFRPKTVEIVFDIL